MQRPPSFLNPKEQCCSKFPDALSSYSLPTVMVPGSIIQALSPQSDTLSPLPSVASSYHPLEKNVTFLPRQICLGIHHALAGAASLHSGVSKHFQFVKRKKTQTKTPQNHPPQPKKPPNTKENKHQSPCPSPRRATENKSSGWFVVVCVGFF